MKHTPGPWEATPGGIVGKRVANGSMDLICDLRGSPFIDDIPYNSLLIAAALELLEACKGAVAALTQNKTYPIDIEVAKQFLSNAIAKAEGRE